MVVSDERCIHENRVWCAGGPGEYDEGFVKCLDCGSALHPCDEDLSGNTVDTRSETVFTNPMTTHPHYTDQCTSPVHDIEHTVTIKTSQARAAAISIARVLNASVIENEGTWHGGLGTDLCEFCEALVILRAAAGYTPTDCLRP